MQMEVNVDWRGVIWYCVIAFGLAWAIDLGVNPILGGITGLTGFLSMFALDLVLYFRSDVLTNTALAPGREEAHA